MAERSGGGGMYATCLFCNGALGRNEALEHFPVGRRLAFDAAKGRLWVVCRHCARWNLTPLEARWEAIEEAERAYRDTKLRASTEHVGLAKLRDGTELVRIGRPLLPEFAAWRYGDVFTGRRRRANLYWGAASAGMLAYFGMQWMSIASVGPLVGSSVVLVGGPAFHLAQTIANLYARRRLRTVVAADDGRPLPVSRDKAFASQIVADPEREAGWQLRVEYRPRRGRGRLWQSVTTGTLDEYDSGFTYVSGTAARRALAQLLPIVNHEGAKADKIRDAVELVTERNPIDLLDGRAGSGGKSFVRPGPNSIGWVNPALRLALEMSLHEADERRALEGELHELESRWREAEEIASIADGMFTSVVQARMKQLRLPSTS